MSALSLDEVCAFIKNELGTRRIVSPDTELGRSLGCYEDELVDLLVALEKRAGVNFPDNAFDEYNEAAGNGWVDMYRRWRRRPLRRGITPR